MYPIDSIIGRNFYEIDAPLKDALTERIPPSLHGWAEERLSAWGRLCGDEIARRAEVIDRNPPKLDRYDRWGFETPAVLHHPEALSSKRDLCEAGYTGFRWLPEVANDSEKRRASALMSTAFTYMLCQSDTGMACACGMTAGVARIVEEFAPAEVREVFLPHLTTTSYEELWDGSMFMTERTGGSDLSHTETVAVKDGQRWLLTGDKWFCSNVDGRAILTLARPEGAGPGTKGLGLYLVPAMLEEGGRNSIVIRRLKDKLGTRSVPTGEVSFEGAHAHEIAAPGSGINQMMEMVNVSRLGVALMGAGIARRCTHEAVTYAREREAFGRKIIDHPMVLETLVDMEVETEAALLLCVESSHLGSRVDVGVATEDERRLLRILVPLAKIRAARTGLKVASEAIEVLGGNGYIEDWPTARQLRDAQCHTIWEGTENVNSLDVLRGMSKTGAHEALFMRVEESAGDEAGAALGEAREAVGKVASAPEVHARRFANLLADLMSATLLTEAAKSSERMALVRNRYIQLKFADQRFPGPPPKEILAPFLHS